jgi:hypothetical protein
MPVLFDKRPVLLAGFAFCLVSVLTSCANTPMGEAFKNSLAADPNLKDNATIFGGSAQSDRQSQSSVQLPNDFPTQIPVYSNAQLQRVEPLTAPTGQGQLTRWSSPDPINLIESFYQQAFQSNQWQVIAQPTDTSGTLVARQNGLEVTVTIPSGTPSGNPPAAPSGTPPAQGRTNASVTEYEIQYVQTNTTAASPSPTQPDVAKPVNTPEVTAQPTPTTPTRSGGFTDLDKLPQELRQQIDDLVALGVLKIDKSASKQNSNASANQFEPNKPTTRREFARWLVAANNQIFANRPGQQIRLASDTSQPAFRDVPRSDRDFQSIQALAEAGLIPSPLTGDNTAALFRPDAPLTRETLILWKVPLDTRQGLPTASLEDVKQTWGFQDAAKIDPKAWRAVVADFQNSEQSNIRRVFGYTTLLQPKKTVTRAEAAAAIWYFGSQGEGLSAKEALQLKNQPSQPSPPSPTPEATPSSAATPS